MEKKCEELDLFHNREGVVRIPFLVQGQLLIPPKMAKGKIEAAFSAADKETAYLRLPGAQIVREPVIDRKLMQYTGEYLYQVMPEIAAGDLIETDIDDLARGLYALSVSDILDYLGSISAAFAANPGLVKRVLELSRLTSEYPDAFLERWFRSIPRLIDREAARMMIDNELSLWGRPGSEFLEGWAPVSISGQSFSGRNTPVSEPPAGPFIRALPTRQLHITAGNTPEVPVISALRAILTKSAAAIKLPFGATLTGSLLALAAASLPAHPLTRHLSLVYWQGGDERVENPLFQPNAFDRIVVWGSPETVTSVQRRAIFTRTVFFNPRYSVSLIGREAFQGDLSRVADKAASDSLIYNQKACTASLVHYIEADEQQADSYAELLRQALHEWDVAVPQFVPPSVRGGIKRLRRGKYSLARWHLNEKEGEYYSGVAVMPGEFDILDHPQCRLVAVRPVDDLSEALKYLHPGVSTAGIYPENRRTALKDSILARGVSNVFPLGECERVFPGMPQDGMPVLSQLVDWKNA